MTCAKRTLARKGARASSHPSNPILHCAKPRQVSACVGRHSPNRRFLPASANRTQAGLSPSVASRIYRRRSVNDIPLSGRRSRSTSMESKERVVGEREPNGACLQPSTRGLPRGFRNSRKGEICIGIDWPNRVLYLGKGGERGRVNLSQKYKNDPRVILRMLLFIPTRGIFFEGYDDPFWALRGV